MKDEADKSNGDDFHRSDLVLPGLASVSALLFFASLFLPAVRTYGGPGERTISASDLLATGWLAPMTLTPQFAWFASPVFAGALRSLWRGKFARAKSEARIAFYLATNTFLWFIWPIGGDEAGVSQIYLKYPLGGCVLWYMAIALLYAVTARAQDGSNQPTRL